MSSIDERVVQMRFDNKQFEQGVKQTMDSLSSLKKGLKLDGATKGLNDLQAAGKGLNLSNIASGVDHIASRFNAMSAIALGALASIGAKAVSVGASLVQSLSIKPLQAGLQEYETNLNSIQTILANTGLKGDAGLEKVNNALGKLNKYSDDTIYNFSQMARNIGTFTAAGVDLDTSTAAIKGIANLAAVSGSNAEQASTAMYQLSQALASGSVKLMDWNSVVNAGMGGKVFQESLKQTARAHGIAVDDIIKKEGSFRDSLTKGWLTSEVLTETLNKFTGDLTEKQLKSMGYNKEQIAGIIAMGNTARDAATKVKTVSQLIGTLQEAAGSGWAKTWQLLFGNFNEARDMFTDVSNVLGGMIEDSANARNKLIGDWNAMGGRKVAIEGISNAFKALMSFIKPIKEAFREIFPPLTAKRLFELTEAFRNFMKSLKLEEDTADNVKRIFKGLFAVLDIGWMIIKNVAGVFATLFGVLREGDSNFLDIAASIGDWLVNLRDALKNGEGLTNFFKKVGEVLSVPIRMLKKFGDILVAIFGSFDDVDLSVLDDMQERFKPLGRIGELIATVWTKAIGIFKAVAKFFGPLAGKMADFFQQLGENITKAFGDIDYSTVLDTINTGLFAGLVLIFNRFFKNGLKIDAGGGFLGSIGEAFDQLTATLKAMQLQLKANALIKIAVAIALLTASVVALSLIDSAKLTAALTAMGIMFGQLLASMAIFEKITASKGFLKMPFVTTVMIGLAIAIDLLTIAVKNLAELDWNGLLKGLSGVSVLIVVLSSSTKLLETSGRGMIRTGAGLILLAVAINILVDAVKDLAGISWEDMAKGLIGVGTLLASLALFTKLAAADKGGIAQGVGIILLATGIKILASAMKDMASMSWEDIAKGLVTTAGGLLLIAAALNAIPPTSILSAAAVLVVASSLGLVTDAIAKMGGMEWENIGKGLTTLAGALVLISGALALLPPSSLISAAAIFIVASSLGMIAESLQIMGNMGWEQIAKGLVMLAGSLGIIAAAMYLMSGALPGAAATIIVAGALKLIGSVLVAFGNMSWGEIAKGLVMLAGAFTVLGLAGLLLTPLVPTLLGLGVAIALMGVGMLAAGAGLLAFSLGLTALSVAGAAATAAVVGIVSGLIGLIPMLMKQIGLGIIAFAETIALAGPSFVKAIVTVLDSIVTAIGIMTPKIVGTLLGLLAALLAQLAAAVPKMIDSGMKLIIGILQGIARNIKKLVTAGTDVIVNFIKGVQDNLPRIIQAGVDLIIAFVEGLAQAIRDNSERMGAAGGELATAVIEGMAGGLTSGIRTVANKAAEMAKGALDAAKEALGINSPSKEFFKVGMYSSLGAAKGIDAYSGAVATSGENLGHAAIEGMRKSISDMSSLVNAQIDVNPTIRPVLDLTEMKKGAGQIGSLLTPNAVVPSQSYLTAKDASIGYQANREVAVTETVPVATKQVTYNQYNNSPKALSAVEIYRNTKNQLSVAKGV